LWRRPRPKLGCGAKERRRRRRKNKYSYCYNLGQANNYFGIWYVCGSEIIWRTNKGNDKMMLLLVQWLVPTI
jgi:hypothetical protein